MKSMRLVLFCMLGFMLGVPAVNAQIPVDEDTKMITYKEVVTQEGTPQKLYNQAMAWINATYTNAADATRVRDPENGKIEIRHRIRLYAVDKNGMKTTEPLKDVVQYTLNLEFRDGRYRFVFTNFILLATTAFPLERWLDKKDPAYVPADDYYLQQVDKEVRDLIASLKKGMVPKVIKEDNW